jgi:putative endopeptidase
MLVAKGLAAFGLGILMLSGAAQSQPQLSGVEISNFDVTVRPQDDFYHYVNGNWLKTAQMPPYVANWNRIAELQVKIYQDLSVVLEGLGADVNLRDPGRRKLRDIYVSYMNEQAIDAAGLAPLGGELDRIRKLKSRAELAAMLGHLQRVGVRVPVSIEVHPDAKDSTHYIADIQQSGLSLPDRDYYLSDQTKMVEIRGKFREHVERILALAGERSPPAEATAIVNFETQIAAAQWTNTANRDPVATYNPVQLSALVSMAPGINWARFAAGSGLQGKAHVINVAQATYLRQFAVLASKTPLRIWRAYLAFRLVEQLSPLLSTPFAAERTSFYANTLSGAAVGRPRWLRAIALIEDGMGDELGRLYVEKFYSPQAMARARVLVDTLLVAFRTSLQSLDWMSAETRREAQAKLAALTVKIGYPDRWKDYSGLRTDPNDLVGNSLRMNAFGYDRDIARLGEPVEHGEWRMTPQQVNGYYEASENQVVIAAALMQPPFFQADAEDAVNYGGAGWWIAHEISHAFDDRGSQYDGHGNLRDWWGKQDHAQFTARTTMLVDQYSRYEQVPGYFVNGALTLGENIADNSGLALAYKAYHLALGSASSPVLDHLSGDQRFYVSFATIWGDKRKESYAIQHIKTDPHSPAQFRVRGALVNQDPFYSAFAVREGDGMYLPPSERIHLW